MHHHAGLVLILARLEADPSEPPLPHALYAFVGCLVVSAGIHISILEFAQQTSESSLTTCFVFLETRSHSSPNWCLLGSHS